MQHLQQQRMINTDQETVKRVTAFRRNFATDPESHQDRNDDNSQKRRACHGIRFGERQRAEQSPLLPLERENRDKRQGDNQQADEQCRADLYRGIGNNLPARCVIQFFIRMLMSPLFEPLMGVFNHHDRGIDHRPNGNGNAPKRHDIGVQPLEMHHDKRDTQSQR